MARLPDNTVLPAIDDALNRQIADLGANRDLSHVAPLEQEKQSALDALEQSKANIGHLVRTANLRADVRQEDDPSSLAVYSANFETSESAYAASSPYSDQRESISREARQDFSRELTSKKDELTRQQEISNAYALLESLGASAQRVGDTSAARLIDQGTELINRLQIAGYLDEVSAREKLKSWAEAYAAQWLGSRPAAEQIALLRGASADDDAVGGAGQVTSRAADRQGTIADLIPKDARARIQLAAQRQLDGEMLARRTEAMERYRDEIDEAVNGNGPLPSVDTIRNLADVSPAAKDVLLRKHAAAATNIEAYRRAIVNFERSDYIWSTTSEDGGRDQRRLRRAVVWSSVPTLRLRYIRLAARHALFGDGGHVQGGYDLAVHIRSRWDDWCEAIVIEEFTSGGGGIPSGGSAAAPALAVSGDTDTGLWSPGTNRLALSTQGVQRIEWAANGYISKGPNAPACVLDLNTNEAGASVPTPAFADSLRIVGLDGASAHIELQSHGNDGSITLRISDGTGATPTGLGTNRVLGGLVCRGYD